MKDYKQNRRIITGGCCKPPSESDSKGNLTDKSKQYIKHLEKLLGMKKIFRI